MANLHQYFAQSATDPDKAKGAVEQSRPGDPSNQARFNSQLDHRSPNPFIKNHDTDFPEPGLNPEYSMQKQVNNPPPNDIDTRDPDKDAEATLNDQDPGERQRENQNEDQDDPLAA